MPKNDGWTLDRAMPAQTRFRTADAVGDGMHLEGVAALEIRPSLMRISDALGFEMGTVVFQQPPAT